MDFARLKSGWLLLIIALIGGSRAAAESHIPLVLERTIVLKNISGRIDHMAIDPARRRLFVAELGNGTLDVLDIRTGTVVRRIDGPKEPQGVGNSQKVDMVAVAAGVTARFGSIARAISVQPAW
jgi:hypothetical protein